MGISKALGPWTLESELAITFFTDNRDFLGGSTVTQDPVYQAQGHVIYAFESDVWAAFDATYYTCGRTKINGSRNFDLQQNWRFGGTLAFPVDARNSVKLYAGSGVSALIDNDFDLIGIGWQYRWGGGP